MEQGCNGGGNVGHFGLSRGAAVAYVPTHEEERNVGVVRAPCSVVCTFHSVGVEAGLQHNLYVTAASMAVAVYGASFHIVGQGRDCCLLHVAGIEDTGVRKESFNGALLYAAVVEMPPDLL